MELLDLPPELRIIIYEYALPSRQTIKVDYLDSRSRQPVLPSLLTVSKQVHTETAPIFFSTNTFEIRGHVKIGTLEEIPARIANLSASTTSSFKHLKVAKIGITINRIPEINMYNCECDCVRIHGRFDVELTDGVLYGQTWQIGSDCHCGRELMPQELRSMRRDRRRIGAGDGEEPRVSR